MGGLYNALFGFNPACIFLAPMLTDENPQGFFPRFRDCFMGEDNETIEIFTRVGGGNREYYEEEIEKLQSMPTYIRDEDNAFDCTYATFTFGVPSKWRVDFDAIAHGDFRSVTDAYVERMQACFPKLNVREILEGYIASEDGDE